MDKSCKIVSCIKSRSSINYLVFRVGVATLAVIVGIDMDKENTNPIQDLTANSWSATITDMVSSDYWQISKELQETGLWSTVQRIGKDRGDVSID